MKEESREEISGEKENMYLSFEIDVYFLEGDKATKQDRYLILRGKVIVREIESRQAKMKGKFDFPD